MSKLLSAWRRLTPLMRERLGLMLSGGAVAAVLVATQGSISLPALAFTFAGLLGLAVAPALTGLLEEFELYIAGLTFLAALVLLDGHYADRAFYEASAQIIPVVFLALTVAARFSVRGVSLGADQTVRIIVVLGLLVGEATSLAALATPRTSSISLAVVAGALAAAGVVIAIQALAGPGERSD